MHLWEVRLIKNMEQEIKDICTEMKLLWEIYEKEPYIKPGYRHEGKKSLLKRMKFLRGRFIVLCGTHGIDKVINMADEDACKAFVKVNEIYV